MIDIYIFPMKVIFNEGWKSLNQIIRTPIWVIANTAKAYQMNLWCLEVIMNCDSLLIRPSNIEFLLMVLQEIVELWFIIMPSNNSKMFNFCSRESTWFGYFFNIAVVSSDGVLFVFFLISNLEFLLMLILKWPHNFSIIQARIDTEIIQRFTSKLNIILLEYYQI